MNRLGINKVRTQAEAINKRAKEIRDTLELDQREEQIFELIQNLADALSRICEDIDPEFP